MRTLQEFCEFIGLTNITPIFQNETNRLVAFYWDPKGIKCTINISKNINLNNKLYVVLHTGLNDDGEVDEECAKLKDTIWIVNKTAVKSSKQNLGKEFDEHISSRSNQIDFSKVIIKDCDKDDYEDFIKMYSEEYEEEEDDEWKFELLKSISGYEKNSIKEEANEPDWDREKFDALTDGQLGDYDDFERNMDDVDTWSRG